MRDPRLLRVVKYLARLINRAELTWRRKVVAAPRYELTGSCLGCGQCCEHPSIQVERFTWYAPFARTLFLWWQRRINGFELERVDTRHRLFVFHCSHYDPSTKQCDSYDSRPLMCRDYPVNLTYDALPQLFDECSHGLVDRHTEALTHALEDAGVEAHTIERIRRKVSLTRASKSDSEPK